MDLSVVIVNYGTFELTKNTTNSILEYSYPFSIEIIVVDNASVDDSLYKLEEYFGDKVKFIASESNNGFAAGNNQALKIVNSEYVLLLNSDTVVWQNTLEDIYYFMENNHMERALVTSLTKRGVKQLRTVSLEFIPSAIYAYTVGYDRFKAFLTSQNL